jgi:cytochrome c2
MTKWMAVAVTLLVLSGLEPAFAQVLTGPAQNPMAGSRVFGAKGCVKCHAVRTVGGKIGPDLAQIGQSRSLEDLAAAMWNHLPQVEPMRQLGIDRLAVSPREAGDLIAFLFSVNYFDPPENLGAGERLFAEKKCIVCHQVAGTGGVTGPGLDSFKDQGSPIFVAAAMWNHGPTMAQAMRTQGIGRPTVTASEIAALIAYLRSPSQGPADAPLHLLPGGPAAGQRLFVQKRCAGCHGEPGGRAGPLLADRRVPRRLTQFAATLWNKLPAMLEMMKGRGISLPPLQADEMAHLVAYLDAVRYFASPGDPGRGRRVLGTKGCLACHAVSVGDPWAPRNLVLARGFDSPAAAISMFWNHVLVKAPGGKREIWSQYRPDEMADLMAWLGSLAAGAVVPMSER